LQTGIPMTILKKVWALILCVGLFMMTAPAFARDSGNANDPHGWGPSSHPYIYSVLGGAAIGAGVGAAFGGAPNVWKGMLVGGGGASVAYVATHPRFGGKARSFYSIAGWTAVGGGVGWTLCGCNSGLGLGLASGFGASSIYIASHAHHPRTASAQQPSNPPSNQPSNQPATQPSK
jgi:hypothetical protein